MHKVLGRSMEVHDREHEKILHFSLQGSLPFGHSLVLNLAFGTLLYLESDFSGPCLAKQEQLTPTEVSVLLPLLEYFPYYCPHEVLYASFYGDGQRSNERVVDARRYLKKAEEDGLWEQEMRAVRSAVSRTRFKVRSFGVDISSILGTGYILVVQRVSMKNTGVD